MKVLLCKRDIEGAFNRIFIRPDLSKLMMPELEGARLGFNQNVVVSHLVLPPGWIDSPAYFQLAGVAIQALHESYGVEDQGWSGMGHFSSFIYVGDAIWVANAFGCRLSTSIEAWEWACERILNIGSVSQRKVDLEGSWETNALILGFEVDTECNTISIPEPKITAARNLIISEDLQPGNTNLRIKVLRNCGGDASTG